MLEELLATALLVAGAVGSFGVACKVVKDWKGCSEEEAAQKIRDFVNGMVPLAYAGILSSGVAYTLQVLGQKNTDPTVASLILSLESVVSVLAGWMILDQALTGRELAGCGLVFCAVVLVQLPGKRQIHSSL